MAPCVGVPIDVERIGVDHADGRANAQFKRMFELIHG
jgi:hypothetical protein